MNTPSNPSSALATALLILALAGCGKSPEQHLQAGHQLLEKGDHPAAILELKSALQAQPGNQDARVALGRAHLAHDDFAAAEKEFSRARELGAGDDLVLPGLAKALLAQGKFAEVLALPVPAYGMSPDALAAVQVTRAIAATTLGKPADVERAIVAAERANPEHLDLLLFKAVRALADGRPTDAGKLVERALSTKPGYVDALYVQAAILQEQIKYDDALAVYQRIAATDARQFRAHLALLELHQRAGRIEQAEQALRAAEATASNVPLVKFSRGVFELRRGNLKEANDALAQVLRFVPDHAPTNLAFAAVSMGLGNFEQTIRSARVVLANMPNEPVALRLLAVSQMKQGEIDGALATIAPLLTADTPDVNVLQLAAELYFLKGDHAQAMRYLDRAAREHPDDARVITRLALTRLAAGDQNAALVDLERAASLGDKPGPAGIAMIMLLINQKKHDEALQAIARLDRKLRASPIVLNLRAAALLGKGDRAGAREALEQAISSEPGFFAAIATLARLDMQEGKPEAARERFEALLARDKNHVGAMLALADLAARSGREKDFVTWLERASKAEPRNMSTRAMLVGYHLEKGDNAKALAQARQALAAAPEHIDALHLIGAVELASGNHDAAIAAYTRATQLAPRSADAFHNLALAYQASQQTAAAREALQRALQLKPDQLKSAEALFRLETSEKRMDAALRLARDYQTRHPALPFGFEREADMLLVGNTPAKAVPLYEQALAKGGGVPTMIKLHLALHRAGNGKAAEQRLAEWVKRYPADADLRAYAAETSMAAQRPRDAVAHYEALLKARPNDVIALNNLAYLRYQLKDARALPMAEKAHQLAPDNPGVLHTLGWILVEQGQVARGLPLLAKAASLRPRQGTVRYHHGVALARAGKKAEARREIEAAINQGAPFPEIEEARDSLRNL